MREPPRAESLWLDALRRLRRQPLSIFSGILVTILILTAIFGPLLAPYDPNAIDMANRFAPPSLEHPFGTDDFARDILSRVMVGVRPAIPGALPMKSSCGLWTSFLPFRPFC